METETTEITEFQDDTIRFRFDEFTVFFALSFRCFDATGQGKTPTLESAIQAIADEAVRNGQSADSPYPIWIELPCGNSLFCKTADDIPRQDTPCPCGNPNHWLVKIEGCE